MSSSQQIQKCDSYTYKHLYSFKINIVLIKSLNYYIQTMQQDGQNIWEKVGITVQSGDQTQNQSKKRIINRNIVQAYNVVEQGLNYIVPSFWYEQLIEINQQVKSLQNIKLPPIQTYVKILQLCGLQSPKRSIFSVKEGLSQNQHLFQNDLFEESNYYNSKTSRFSKITNFINSDQFQWRIVSPFLWKLIETSIMPIEGDNSQRYLELNCMNSGASAQKTTQQQMIPKIAVFIQRQFILQKGQNKVKGQIDQNGPDFVQILHRGKMYRVQNKYINEQITSQLKNMTADQLNIVLIVDQNAAKFEVFQKIEVQGYFSRNLHFKDLVQSIIQIQLLKKHQNIKKLFVYDKSKQKIKHKMTSLQHVLMYQGNNLYIVSTSQLNQISQNLNHMKRQLNQLLESDFNYPPPNQNKQIEQQKMKEQQKEHQHTNEMTIFGANYYKERQINQLIQFLKSNKKGDEPQKQKIEKKIQNGTFYRSDQQCHSQGTMKNQSNVNQNQDVRNFDSATTNFDTAQLQLQKGSQGLYSESSYKNQRLHKHQSYSRVQRMKRSKNFLYKRRNYSYAVKNHRLSQALNSQFLDCKKRINHKVFTSLSNLDQHEQFLGYLLGNMRKVSLESIYFKQNQVISHPYERFCQAEEKEKQKSMQNWQWYNKKPKKSEKSRNTQDHERQLQMIARKIESIYEPEEKYASLQKQQKQPLQKMCLYEDYELLSASKKDYQEIRTIVDNSQGPYTQVQKQSLNSISLNCRPHQTQSTQKNSFRNPITYMSDGNNDFQDNQQTI